MISIRLLDRNTPIDKIRQVANIHQEEITEGFLTSLGSPFLILLYKFFSSSPYSILIVAEQKEKIVGFICGATNTKKVIQKFILRYFCLVFIKLFTSFASVSNVSKMFEVIFYYKQKRHAELPNSEILNFCVTKKFKRKGIGNRLFSALAEKYSEIGINEIKIVTGEEQKDAQMFYESLSARKVAEIEVHKGVKSFVYLFSIGKDCHLE